MYEVTDGGNISNILGKIEKENQTCIWFRETYFVFGYLEKSLVPNYQFSRRLVFHTLFHLWCEMGGRRKIFPENSCLLFKVSKLF